MRKDGFKTITLGLVIATLLTGCGSNSGYSSNSMESFATTADEAYYDTEYVGYSTGTTINSSKADYSYSVGANGTLKDKETALSFYEDVQNYVDSVDGRVNNVNNDFSFMDSKYYYSDSIKYRASGYVYFDVEVNEEDVQGVIDIFDTFCKEHKLDITDYDQRITSYEKYNVVDERDDDYYYKDTITKDDLDKALEYSTVTIRINYYIERGNIEKIGLWITTFVKDLWDSIGDIITVLVNVAIVVFAGLFVILLPAVKIYKKSLYKYNKKHPEYSIAKRVIIENNDKIEVDNKKDITNTDK